MDQKISPAGAVQTKDKTGSLSLAIRLIAARTRLRKPQMGPRNRRAPTCRQSEMTSTV
jgi:hypothetical protein